MRYLTANRRWSRRLAVETLENRMLLSGTQFDSGVWNLDSQQDSYAVIPSISASDLTIRDGSPAGAISGFTIGAGFTISSAHLFGDTSGFVDHFNAYSDAPKLRDTLPVGAPTVFAGVSDHVHGTSVAGLLASPIETPVTALDVGSTWATWSTGDSGKNIVISVFDTGDLSTHLVRDMSRFNGTSASGRPVNGVIGLMLEANPYLSYRDVQEVFARSARQSDDGLSHSGVDAELAMDIAKRWMSIADLSPEETAGASINEHNFVVASPGSDIVWLELSAGTGESSLTAMAGEHIVADEGGAIDVDAIVRSVADPSVLAFTANAGPDNGDTVTATEGRQDAATSVIGEMTYAIAFEVIDGSADTIRFASDGGEGQVAVMRYDVAETEAAVDSDNQNVQVAVSDSNWFAIPVAAGRAVSAADFRAGLRLVTHEALPGADIAHALLTGVASFSGPLLAERASSDARSEAFAQWDASGERERLERDDKWEISQAAAPLLAALALERIVSSKRNRNREAEKPPAI